MDFLVTGTIRSSHGLDGFVKVESASGEVDHFADLSEVYLRKRTALQPNHPDSSGKRYEIEAVEGSAALLLIKFKGIDTPEAAKQLAGMNVLVPRDNACPLEDDEYYVVDLCQCVLVYDGKTIGRITDVMEGGSGDLLEVTLSEGDGFGNSKTETRFVPLRDEFIGTIDMKAKTVELMHRWILE